MFVIFVSQVLRSVALKRLHPRCLSRVCNYAPHSFERRKPAAWQNKRRSPPNCGGFNRSRVHAEGLVLAADWAKGGGDSLAQTHQRTHARTHSILFIAPPTLPPSLPPIHQLTLLRSFPPPSLPAVPLPHPYLLLLIGRRCEVARSPLPPLPHPSFQKNLRHTSESPNCIMFAFGGTTITRRAATVTLLFFREGIAFRMKLKKINNRKTVITALICRI